MNANIEWRALTRIARKSERYARETYFREGLADAVELWGEGFDAVLHRAALLMIKPDGLAAGKAATIVEFLREQGFSIMALEQPLLNRLQWRELWRFQLTSATLDRFAVNDLVLCQPTLLLVLRQAGEYEFPATVRLSVLKGPSDVASQPADCLRRRIAQPNRIFSFFHVADEPADLLRELAILLDGPARKRVLSALLGDGLTSAEQETLKKVLAASSRGSRTLIAVGAVKKLAHELERVRAVSQHTAACDRVQADLDRMQRDERIEWHAFVQALLEADIRLDRWELATLGASFIVYDEPGFTKDIVAVEPTQWLTPHSEN